MALLTVCEREALAAAHLYDLLWRLQAAYRRNGGSLQPDMVRSPGMLRDLVEQLETLAGDCRELMRCQLEGLEHECAVGSTSRR